MKKLTTIFTALALLILSSAFSAEVQVPAKVKSEFNSKFATASDVSWMKIQGQYIASFTLNNQSAAASFDEDGKWLLTSRYVTMSELPLLVSSSLQDRFNDCKVSDKVIELTSEIETIYYIKAQSSKFYYNLKSNSSGDVTVENRLRTDLFPPDLSKNEDAPTNQGVIVASISKGDSK